MDLRAWIEREARKASRLLGLEVRRAAPERVEVVEDLPGGGCTRREGDALLVSADLTGDSLPYVLAKEAAVSLMVPQADEVPQVHDLAWIYSSAPRELWERCRVPLEGPFHDYDPLRLFSLVPTRERLGVLGTAIRMVNASARLGNLEFPTYMAILHGVVYWSVGLSKYDVKLILTISENPRATSDYMKRMGMGGSSLTKSAAKLKALGMLSGPESVDYRKLGLSTFVISFPNRKGCRRAFWRFPYTRGMLVPASGEVDAHSFLSYPNKGIDDLLSLGDLGLGVFLVRETVLRFNFDPPGDPFEAVSPAGPLEARGSGGVPASPPSVRIDGVDLGILNRVLGEGRVSAAALRNEGVPEARSRLKRLREAEIIVRSYRMALPTGVGRTVVVVEGGPEEMGILSGVLRSGGHALVRRLEGEAPRLMGELMAPPEIRGDVLRVVRALYGERLLLAEESVGIEPGWRLPADLWDEESQGFRWREPLQGLVRDLEACLPRSPRSRSARAEVGCDAPADGSAEG